MNTTIATLLVSALALGACSTAGAAITPASTRQPTSDPTSSPTPTPTPTATTPPTASASAPPSSGAGSMDGRQFLSGNVTAGGQPRPLVDGTRIRLTFRDGSVSASAGCNTIGGNYTIEDGNLIFSGGSMTEMGCDEPRMAQDEWLIDFLGSSPALTLTGDDLVLTGDDTAIALRDSEVVEPDQALVGPTWTLTSIISGDAVSTVPAGVISTLSFGDAGTVDVNPGCNAGAGSYSVDTDSIAFSDIITTKMACLGPAMQVESAVLDVLSSERLTYTIDANSLTISAGDVGLQFSAG